MQVRKRKGKNERKIILFSLSKKITGSEGKIEKNNGVKR